MAQIDNRTAFLELPGPKLVSSIATRLMREQLRLLRQERNKAKSQKKATKMQKEITFATALSLQEENKQLLEILPRSPLYPVAERRESAIRKRAKASKRSKETCKTVAAKKAKAARILRMKETRQTRESEARQKAGDEWEQAQKAAFIAAKKAEPRMKVTFVDNIDQVKSLVDEVMSLSNPALYLDAEGISLSRTGELVLLQMYIDTDAGPHTYVVDVWTLKTDGAFHTPGTNHPTTTFKTILENPAIPKLFWDCRMDSEALYAQHQISLTSVLDIQLLEVARRACGQPLVPLRGYADCVANDAGLDCYDRTKMRDAKGAKNLFIPRFGGSWDALTARPISPAILDYCAGDVRYMPNLVRYYSEKLLCKDRPGTLVVEVGKYVLRTPAAYFGEHGYEWAGKVVKESAKRVERSQNEGWDRRATPMSWSPWRGLFDQDF